MKTFDYDIGGKQFTQSPLVLGQINQLLDLLKGLALPADMTPLTVVSALGDRLPKALAVVLNPEGTALKDKDLEVIAEHIAFEMEPELAIKVVEDFFDCNPLFSIFDRLTALAQKVRRIEGIGSIGSASSSQKETSRDAMPSSGVTH